MSYFKHDTPFQQLYYTSFCESVEIVRKYSKLTNGAIINVYLSKKAVSKLNLPQDYHYKDEITKTSEKLNAKLVEIELLKYSSCDYANSNFVRVTLTWGTDYGQNKNSIEISL